METTTRKGWKVTKLIIREINRWVVSGVDLCRENVQNRMVLQSMTEWPCRLGLGRGLPEETAYTLRDLHDKIVNRPLKVLGVEDSRLIKYVTNH